MSLTTDFNQSPYFDDFDETKNYHRVLFKPSVAVQARELTQLQTILQNQVERFGDNILREGTIIRGGNFVEEAKLAYVKVLDIAFTPTGSETATDVNTYVDMKAVGQITGVEAIIIATEYGLESQSPDLSTLFVKYTKTTVNGSNQNVSKFSTAESIQLYSKDANGDYTVQEHLLTVAGSVEGTSAIGTGYGVRCGEGIIYQKGNFIRFENALTIVSKYTSAPDGIVVGFQTIEEIIDSNEDSSLLDNANGFNNENAPGADRLKLTPTLVVKTLAEAAADERFFAVQEYSNGRVVRRKLTTQYNQIEKQMEIRTSEESGDYVVSRFDVSVRPNPANTTLLNAYVGAGIAYVDGQRVELLNEIDIAIPDANTFGSVINQDINTNYGSYVTANTYSGKFDFTSFEPVNLKNSGGTTIGTARTRSVTKRSGSEYRIYLFDIKMSSNSATFGDVRTIAASASTGTANTVLVNGKTTLVDATFNKSYYPVGKSFIKSVDAANTDFVYRTAINQQTTSNTFTITVGGTDVFPYTVSSNLNSDELLDLIVVANSSVGSVTTGESIGVNSAALDSTGKQLTITLAKNPGSALWVSTYANVKKQQASISTKTLKTVYVRVNANTNAGGTTGSYSLGLPDVYAIDGVWKVSSATDDATLQGYATSNSATSNYTRYFTLNKNASDTFYGLSAIKKSKSLAIAANDKIIIRAQVFQKTAGDGHFFTVDSYPVDDTTIPLPSGKIRTENIPTETSSNGTKYYLRDVIDLRPYAANTAAYAELAADATLNPAATVAFTGPLYYPAPNETIETSYTYYLGRNDIVIIDKNGNFELIQGVPAENPSYPAEPTKGMLLARLVVPPFPTLSTSQANRIAKPEYGVQVSSNQTQRYTMKDIGDLDKRLKNMEYYVSLSALETTAKDFLVTDSNGLTRFKNGIFVDNFENLILADVNGGEFAAAIEQPINNITPKIRQYSLGLRSIGNANTTNFNSQVTTLNKSDRAIVSASQPYATTYKSCTTSFYNYAGQMKITPEYDSGPDTVKAPDVNFDFDLATPFIEFTEALADIIPLSTTDVKVLTKTVGRTTTTTTTTRTTTLETTAGQATTVNVGDFVRDVSFMPFMRSQPIQIRAIGLRPNTRFYFFFDGVDVNAHVAKATFANGVLTRTSVFGSQVMTSDANGELNAVFLIPDSTFYVGDRKIEILDVDNINAKDAATSSASAAYSGYNFASTKSGLTTTTRPPKFTLDVDVDVNTVVTQRNRSDPIAQTFVIENDESSDTDVLVTKVDLYFAKKSRAGKGVGIQIREVVNGYPSGDAVPFSSVHLSAAEVNAPSASIATTAINATTVTFDAPVALKVNTEYAIVIAPDGNDPDYLVWISRTGGVDIDSGLAVTQDTNAGVLFTSTNNKAWTPYQNENLKFKLYAANFTSTSGSVTLTNADHEFFSISEVNGTFRTGEDVFEVKTSYASGSVSLVSGSATIAGVGTSFTTNYAIDQHIIVNNGGNYEALKIKTIANNDFMTTYSPSKITASGVTTHYTSPVGQIVYVNTREPARMIISNSTAKSGFVFADSTTIRGEVSEATAFIDSIDDLPVSYIQPAIYRSNFSKTRTTLTASKLYNGSGFVSKDLAFNDTNFLTENTFYVKSKSNDPTNTSFELNVGLFNTSTTTIDTSPVIDYEISSVMVAEYLVNAANTTVDDIDPSEATNIGLAEAKYVSRMIELADGLDAEDMRIILGAYKPTGTDIRVYAKFKSSTDNRDFKDIVWTKLALKPETASTSSTVNRYDYREYEYQLQTGTAGSLVNGGNALDVSGTINYKDENGVLFNDYKYFAIKIVMLANGHNVVPRLKDLRALALS